MRRPMATAGAVLLVAGILLFAWRGVSDPAGIPRGVAPGRPAPPTLPLEGAPGPPASPVPPGPEEDGPPGPVAGSVPREEPAAGTWRIRGRLNGFDPAEGEPPARITVLPVAERSGDSPREARGESRSDGTYDFDVTSIFEGGFRVIELDVAVDHPGHLPSRTRIPVPAAGSEGGDPRVVEATIAMQRAGVLAGRVLDGRLRPVPSATVAAFAVEGDDPAPVAVDRCATDDEGRWRLRLLTGRRYLVIAAGSGRRPASGDVFGGATAMDDLVLDEGVSISGRVTGEAGTPVQGAVIEAGPAGPGRTLRVGREYVRRIGDRWESAPGTGSADRDGRYRIEGLVPMEYEVRIESLGPGIMHRVLLDHFDSLSRGATAPATGVDFSVEGARVVVEIRDEGKPVPGASLLVRSVQGMDSISADDRGRVEMVARPEAAYRARAWANDRGTGWKEFTAPSAGGTATVIVEFPPRPYRGTLRIVPEGPGAASVDRIGVGLFLPESGPELPDATRDLRREGDAFLLHDVMARPWRMVVRPDGNWTGGEGLYQEVEREVEMPAEGTTEVRIPLRPAGRLRIAVRRPEGTFVGADCGILDPSGNAVPAWFLTRSTAGGWRARTGGLIGDGPNAVDPPLVPGRYRVEFSAKGYLDRTVEVLVEAGRIAEVDVTLETE